MNPRVGDQEVEQNGDTWTVCINSCDLRDEADETVRHMAQAVRDAYGESEIVEALANIDPDPGVSEAFDVDLIISAVRRGLPNPVDELSKPLQLRNYRSETCEFFAREILRLVHNVDTPGALHACKGNAMQPLLGYDGWGLQNSATGDSALVLIQVKGSDDVKSPPPVADALADECAQISSDINKLARALTAHLIRVKGTQYAVPLVRMLQELGADRPINLVVAPVIVRGCVEAKMTDLDPIKSARTSFGDVVANGTTVMVGAPLEEFGRLVMDKARQS